MRPVVGPTDRPLEQRGRLLRFVPFSLAIHALFVVPWVTLLLALLSWLGMPNTTAEWKKVDAPTVIPINIDELDEEPTLASGDPSGGTAGPGAAASDAGIAPDAPSDALSDALVDAKVRHGVSDASSDAAVGDAAPPLKATERDPLALLGGPKSIVSKSDKVNLSVLVRTDHLREHPVGKDLGPLLLRIRQWQPFLEGTEIDPVRDFDVIYAFGPHFYETSRLSIIIAHHEKDEEFALVLKGIAERHPPSEVLGDEKNIEGYRARIDESDRVLVLLPGGVLITPLDGEKQARALGRALRKKKRAVAELLPQDANLLLIFTAAKPPDIVRTRPPIPDDLRDVFATLRTRKDHGVVLDAEAKTDSKAHAVADAATLQTIVEGFTPRGLIGMVARRYIDGYTVKAVGDKVKVHHELDGDRVDSIWTLLRPSFESF